MFIGISRHKTVLGFDPAARDERRPAENENGAGFFPAPSLIL
jgi:hypothetical protein